MSRLWSGALVLALIGAGGAAGADDIRDYCQGVSGGIYSFTKACIRDEREAKARLEGRQVDPDILSGCRDAIGEGYGLIESCVREEERSRVSPGQAVADPRMEE